jgi:opacity protein-like surface antigen
LEALIKIPSLAKIFSIPCLIGLGMMSSAAMLAQEQESKNRQYAGETLGHVEWDWHGNRSAASAREPQDKRIPKIETFVSFGKGAFGSGNIPEGSGLELQSGVLFHPFAGRIAQRLGIGFRFGRFEHERQYSSQFWFHSVSGTIATAFGEVSYRFNDSRVQPFVSLGLGMVRSNHTHKDTYLSDSTLFTNQIKGDAPGFSFGTGLKVGVINGLSVVPEIRFRTTCAHYNWHVSGLSAGLSYGW